MRDIVKVQNGGYTPCMKGAGHMVVVVDPSSPSSSGAVIRKQLVGCILLY